MEVDTGKVVRIAGSVVFGTGFKMNSKNVIVKIGEDDILGEVVQVLDDILVIQAYEETEGITVGDKIESTNAPLLAELGPGLLGQIIDGLQRPTNRLMDIQGPFLKRGTIASPFDKQRTWEFNPIKSEGEKIRGGQAFGFVFENGLKHPILIPPDVEESIITVIAKKGNYNGHDTLISLDPPNHFGFYHYWEIRKIRPAISRSEATEPLITGQRIIDSLFPIAKGSSSTVSGGFGTGKTALEQTIAKHARVDIVILILIGERGNEVATALEEFSQLTDKENNLLLNRTVVIANTSNMPVAARESSIYLGLTIGEYYRDLGYDVAILADSMSRWAESVREISGRLEEMPAEEGYPSYMSKDLGKFFERAGNFELKDGNKATITFMAAVSPPGGDFTEPVTQAALRVTGSFWALSTQLARSRHFPAIDWKASFSLYGSIISQSIGSKFENWETIRVRILSLLKQEETLEQSVRLLGRDSLSEQQKAILDLAKLIKESFLLQNAYDDIDKDCSLEKQYLMMEVLNKVQTLSSLAISKEITSESFSEKYITSAIKRMRFISEDNLSEFDGILALLNKEIGDFK